MDVKNNLVIPESYTEVFEQLRRDIQASQLRAASSVTKELVLLYWRTGNLLSMQSAKEKWGAKILQKLTSDLLSAFPGVRGFSVRNLQYMRKFAESYPEDNCAAAAAQIPWGHNLILLDKIPDDLVQRIWYIQQAVENGWSRSMLEMWIESNLFGRKGKAITNFKHALPFPESDIAEQLIKDPYNFGFLALEEKHREKDLEQGLMDHLQNFLLELGDGFAFVGRQYPVSIGGEDFFIDLLFYHVKLRCYFVVELKAADFDPRDAGQINFYLSAVDDLLRHPNDEPSIGILLCKTKNKVKVEYALRNCQSPIGVASYEAQIMQSLPSELRTNLPTVEELEMELSMRTQ